LRISWEPTFQVLDLLFELNHFLSQGEQFSYQRFEQSIFFSDCLQFFSKSLQLFFLRHTFTLVGFSLFGKSQGDLSSYIIMLIV